MELGIVLGPNVIKQPAPWYSVQEDSLKPQMTFTTALAILAVEWCFPPTLQEQTDSHWLPEISWT